MSNASNELSIFNADKPGLQRISKTGKVTYRTALGILTSGNASERTKLSTSVMETLWVNSTYKPIVAEVERVFAPLFKHNKLFNMSFAAACGLSIAAPKKVGLIAFFEAVLRAEEVKPSKGEKAIYVAAMRRIVAHEKQLALELAEKAEQERLALEQS